MLFETVIVAEIKEFALKIYIISDGANARLKRLGRRLGINSDA